MNITEQACFKRAVAIAGWAINARYHGGATLRPVSSDCAFWGYWCGEWCDTGCLTEVEAEAIYEKHFREWLEARGLPISPMTTEFWAKAYHVERNGVLLAEADDYFACACLAVVECEKKEHDDGSQKL